MVAPEVDWHRTVRFCGLPEEHWKHLRTTNVAQSPFDSVRPRTTPAKRFKRIERATAPIWKLMVVAEKRFRKRCSPPAQGRVGRLEVGGRKACPRSAAEGRCLRSYTPVDPTSVRLQDVYDAAGAPRLEERV